MDYGKYQYQEQKRTREAKKHQKVILVKEIKFRPKVDEHDYQFKKNHIERFLSEGDKVKATVFFRGREMAHPEIGHRILMRLLEDLADVAQPETMPRQEGNQMHTILTGKKGAAPKKQAAPKPTAKKRRVNGRDNGNHEAEDTPRSREAVQEDRHRQDRARLGVQAPHPHQQDHQEQAPDARHGGGLRRRCAEAASDAAV